MTKPAIIAFIRRECPFCPHQVSARTGQEVAAGMSDHFDAVHPVGTVKVASTS